MRMAKWLEKIVAAWTAGPRTIGVDHPASSDAASQGVRLPLRAGLQGANRGGCRLLDQQNGEGARSGRRCLSLAVALTLLLGLAPSALAADDALPFDRATLRAYVLSRLSVMAGRKLEVTGDIEIDLGWMPTMRLEGVRVANADWARAPYLMEMEALELELDMRALLDGDVRLPRLSLIHPALFLEVSEHGAANWILGGDRQTVVESAAAPGGKPGNLPRIDRLEVKGGELAYLDHDDPNPGWIRGTITAAGGTLDDDGVDVGVTGRLGEAPFTIVVRTASLSAMRAGSEPNPVFLSATSGPSRLTVDGTVVAPFELRGFDLALEARGAGLDQLPLLTGLPASPPFELDARLHRNTAQWRLGDLAASIGRSRVRGKLALDLSRKRPRLTADLTAETLVVDELLALAPARGEWSDPAESDRSEAERSQPGSEDPDPPGGGIDLTGLTALDADFRAQAQRLEYGPWHLNEARVHLLIDDGVLRLSPLSATVGDGRVAADLTLTTDPLAGQARLEIESLDLSKAVSGAGQDAGTLTGEELGVLDGTLLMALPPLAQPPAQPPGQKSKASAPAVPQPRHALQRLRVQLGQLSYREPENDTRLRLTLAADPGNARPKVGIEGRFRGLAVDGTLRADPLPALVQAERYAAEGQVRLGDGTTRFEAVLLAPPSLRQFRIDFEADRLIIEGAEITDLAARLELDKGRMRLGPLRLNYRRPAQQTALSVDLRSGASADVLRGEIQGRLRGEPLSASLRSDAWLELAEQASSGTWELRATSAQSRLRAAGELRDLLSPSSLKLAVSASGPNAANLSDLLGAALPRTPPFDLRLALTRDGGRIILDDIDATLGESDLNGRIAIDPDNLPTAVNVDLRSDRLDLDDLLDLMDQRPRVEPDLVFPNRPLGLAELGRQLQGQVSYRAAQVVAARLPLSDVSLEARLRDGRLHLEPLRIGAGGGDLRLTLDLDTAADPPVADLDGEIRRLNLRQALAAYPIADESLGVVGGQLRLWLAGRTPAALAGSADGGLFLLMTGGVLEQLLVEAAGLDVGEAVLAALDGGRVPIDCGYLNLRARDGQIEIDKLLVDTRDSLFVGGGDVDLDRQRVDLVVEARPKDLSLPTFGSPLRLSGPLKDLKLNLVSAELIGRTLAAVSLASVQPLAALLPLIETGGSSGSAYCSGLMEQLREAHR